MNDTDHGLKSIDLVINRIREYELETINYKPKLTEQEQTPYLIEQCEIINNFYRIVNYFIREIMYLDEPISYERLREIGKENGFTTVENREIHKYALKEAIRQIKLNGKYRFVKQFKKLTYEDVKSFNNILGYHVGLLFQ